MAIAIDTVLEQPFDPLTTPVSVRVAGLLCLAVGIGSIVTMFQHALDGTAQVDLGFIGIFLGKRLLEGSPSCRRWTIFFSGTGALMGGGYVLWRAYDYVVAEYQSTFPLVAVYEATMAGSAIFVFCILLRCDIRRWFDAPRTESAGGGSWALPASIALTILIGQQALLNELDRQQLLGLFHLSTNITLRDAETGEPIPTMQYHSDVLKNGSPDKSSFPRLSVSSESRTTGEVVLKLTGFLLEPIEITFSPEGYRSKTVRLTRSTVETLTLDMDRQP